mmetsp:Transcript_3272/g.9901  ORF Transcript_3272/g.9901 Transcript_3272/m.9901 type:complete len:95 (+) Transcript_3272:537-821(+)
MLDNYEKPSLLGFPGHANSSQFHYFERGVPVIWLPFSRSKRDGIVHEVDVTPVWLEEQYAKNRGEREFAGPAANLLALLLVPSKDGAVGVMDPP